MFSTVIGETDPDLERAIHQAAGGRVAMSFADGRDGIAERPLYGSAPVADDRTHSRHADALLH